MNIFELFAAAGGLERKGDLTGAVALYQGWIDANPDDPAFHAALFNLGTIKLNAGDGHGALTAFNECIRVRPDFVPAVISQGSALEKLGQMELALQYWDHAVAALGNVNADTIGYKVTVLKQLARVRMQNQQNGPTEEVLRQSLSVSPQQREELQHWINARQRQCKWPLPQALGPITVAQAVAGMAPLTLAYYTDDPMLALANAYSHSKLDLGWPEQFKTSADFAGRRRQPDGKLRIGYVSSDLRNHAIGYLTAEMFALHDRSRVEVTVFFCGLQVEDQIMRRIHAGVDHWVDINGIADAEVAAMVEQRGIDILVDVNGHTRDARTKMLSLRPAPVIVNWLGYPGTMGTPYHHYILADEAIIPAGFDKYYSERVVRLPCYQPNDRQRTVAPVAPTRAQYGLPEDVTVFCCFNGSQKLTRYTLDRWLEILKRVDDSVLWMLRTGAEAEQLVHAKVVEAGVDPARVIFAPHAANPDHIARYALADLFLDSSPYGAHTTASDALWMGVPVLTIPGRAFHSRVCASLVRAAGAPEFICATPDDYVRRAVELGKDRPALLAAKQKLLAARANSLLFDTNRFVRALEDAFDRMWAEWEAGDLPVPDLTNLDLYLEFGSRLDHDGEEFGFIPDYEERYRRLLAHRHALSPITFDQRLWPHPD